MIKSGIYAKSFRYLLIIIFMFGLVFVPLGEIHAQDVKQNDTIIIKPHSPNKAAIYSAVLPGLGQGYNKKYWKIPIVYAGFGVLTYFIVSNAKEYRKYKEAYTYVANGDSTGINNDYVGKYDEQQLLDGKDYHRRNMELSYIITGLWYILNIVDASVDAHFFDYDVSDDLSIKLDPMFHVRPEDFQTISGVKLTIKF